MFWQGRRNRTKRRAHTRTHTNSHTHTHTPQHRVFTAWAVCRKQRRKEVAAQAQGDGFFLLLIPDLWTENKPIFSSLCWRHRGPGPSVAHYENHCPTHVGGPTASPPMPLNKVLFLSHWCFQPSIKGSKTYIERQYKFPGWFQCLDQDRLMPDLWGLILPFWDMRDFISGRLFIHRGVYFPLETQELWGRGP